MNAQTTERLDQQATSFNEDKPISPENMSAVSQLLDYQLSFIGGGSGNVIFG